MRHRPRSRPSTAMATLLAATLVLGACSDSDSDATATGSEQADDTDDTDDTSDTTASTTTGSTGSTDASATTSAPSDTGEPSTETTTDPHEGHDDGSTAPTTPSEPAGPAGPASPIDMVQVPAGAYTIGIDASDQESLATTTVDLAAFHLDVYEVSNAQYYEFVQTLGAQPSSLWPASGMPAEIAQQPVVAVAWQWAESYCRSLGKRLPTEAEWEAAARGTGGALYPWGDDVSVVDLDSAGTRPVGAEPANVSPVGVHDTVGSVWEWVAAPATEVEAGRRVRRGGEYGRVRHGSAHRQVVDPNNVSVLEETGFRCATDSVDESIQPLQFSSGHAPGDDSTTAAPPISLAPGEFVNEVFEDPRSGWADTSSPGWTTGYHAPTWYHVDASQANVQVFAIAPYRYDDAVVETSMFIDKVGSESGRFRYGLVFRADGEVVASPDGVGPSRPRDFYVLAINPREGIWELLHQDNLPLRVKISGPLPEGVTGSSAQPDRLRVTMTGSLLVLAVNDTEVGRFDTEGYHLSGGVGFFSQTFDETKLHVHFDSLSISQV